jgi:hypothetical protein
MIREIKVVWIRPRGWRESLRVRLLESITVAGRVIPIGFITDGNSTPFGLRWLFKPFGKMFAPAIVHDYMLQRGFPRRECDAAYLEAGKDDGVSFSQIYPMYAGVSLYTRWLEIKSKITGVK